MRLRLFAVVICSLGFLVGSGRIAFAGVVMAETSTATSPDGRTNSQVKTIYLQGNKLKVEKRHIAAITDLDRSVIYIIDKQHHDAEIPLQKLGPSPRGNARGPSITLNSTGNVRMVANLPCREYRATGGDRLERVTISACVSTDAPGAREVSEFDRKMIARLGGQDSQHSSHGPADAVMLEKQSVVSFRLPDPSHGRPYRMASLSAHTRVNQIEVKPLPAETFRPPKGFSQLRSRRGQSAPPVVPGTASGTFEVVAPGAFGEAWPQTFRLRLDVTRHLRAT